MCRWIFATYVEGNIYSRGTKRGTYIFLITLLDVWLVAFDVCSVWLCDWAFWQRSYKRQTKQPRLEHRCTSLTTKLWERLTSHSKRVRLISAEIDEFFSTVHGLNFDIYMISNCDSDTLEKLSHFEWSATKNIPQWFDFETKSIYLTLCKFPLKFWHDKVSRNIYNTTLNTTGPFSHPYSKIFLLNFYVHIEIPSLPSPSAVACEQARTLLKSSVMITHHLRFDLTALIHEDSPLSSCATFTNLLMLKICFPLISRRTLDC